MKALKARVVPLRFREANAREVAEYTDQLSKLNDILCRICMSRNKQLCFQ